MATKERHKTRSKVTYHKNMAGRDYFDRQSFIGGNPLLLSLGLARKTKKTIDVPVKVKDSEE